MEAVDGNAIGGLLLELFGTEMTSKANLSGRSCGSGDKAWGLARKRAGAACRFRARCQLSDAADAGDGLPVPGGVAVGVPVEHEPSAGPGRADVGGVVVGGE